MRRTAGWLTLIALFIVAAVGAHAAPVSQAQSGAFLPAILSFTSDTSVVGYADVEAGSAQVTLSWQTINTDDHYAVTLETYHQNSWASLLGAGEVLPLSGSKLIPVMLPENFGVPTYRLSLRNRIGDIIEQQFVTIPYSPAAEAAPQVVSFTTEAQSVDTNLLIQNNVRLVVHWQIEHRQPSTLIRFDQVRADGSTVTAEQPRRMLWVPSTGDGAVVPRPSASKDDLVFRITLINALDGSVYDQADLSVPVIGSVVVAVPAGVQTGNPMIAAAPQVASDGSVVLNWDAGDAANVDLLQTSESGPTMLYIELPPSGSMTIPIPEGSEGVTYTLRAYSATGEVTTGEVSVSPESAPGG